MIGGLFITATDQIGCGNGSGFGHADHFEDENAVENLAGGRGGHDNP